MTKIMIPVVLLIAGGCQKNLQPESDQLASAEVAANAEVVQEYSVVPSHTDPAINSFNTSHFVSVKEGAVLKNTLFLFLPGSYRAPAESKGIERKAASLGYHTIGLMYANNYPVNPMCKNTDDTTCHRRARQEVIDGIDRHPSFSVDPPNSILNRLTKLLIYLNNTKPTQNWGQFLSSGTVNWSKVIIAGHSQGAAIAGVLGKTYPIKKVIMFSMIDFLTSGKIPDWQKFPLNKDKFFAITHPKDELVPYAKVVEGWGYLGMTPYGPIKNVDLEGPPYQSTHTLITTFDPTTTLMEKYHNAIALDTYAPKDVNGKFIYDAAWGYLIDAPTGGNQIPVTTAGPDQSVNLATNPSPTVNANASKDLDGWIVSFAWSKVSGPASYSFVNANTGQTRINNLVPGVYVFRVTATDNKGAKGTDDVQLTVSNSSSGNQLPLANAGADQSIPLSWNYSPNLNATTSKDPDGWITAFAWSKVSGPASYSLATPNSGQTRANNLVAGTYVFRVTVTDNKGGKSSDDVTVVMY